MKKIKLTDKSIIYVDRYRQSLTNDKLCVYDSNKNFIDYYEMNGKNKKDYKKHIKHLKQQDNFSLFDEFCGSYDYGLSPFEIMSNYCDDIQIGYGIEETSEEVSSIIKDMCTMNDKQLCDEYDINKIGNYYFRGNW